jgi:O-acetyl-ADP-ribose deacetylase (regulator of RNase III)
MMQKEFSSGRRLRLQTGDITKVPADVIVNAANSSLRGGGGVDGAIHRAGGPDIMRELDDIRSAQGGCLPGSAVATGAGRLPARFVFHAVGPIYEGGNRREAETLASCYRTCLRMADERGIQTISFPSISTGAYGYPVEEAAKIAIGEVAALLGRTDTSLQEVTFVLFDNLTFKTYSRALGLEGTVE